ncbi:MAG TPA: TonB-dependent receptor, partial [Chitinophagaceae bacterium]|nr:TonB-dependent receptor [Chitinophagaceae bacterium]
MSFIGQKLNKGKTGSSGLNINYSNLAPYFSVVPQKYHYSKAPEAINTEFNVRQKVKNGIFKLYAYANYNELGFSRPNLDDISTDEHFRLRNQHVFSNATYSGRLKQDWQLFAGASFSYNKDKINMTGFQPVLTNRLAQSKIMFTKSFTGLTKLYIGTEYQNIRDGIVAVDSIAQRYIHENYLAGFIESDVYYSSKLLSRMGVRYEYSALLHKAVISPRVSLAYKVNDRSQFSFAYGTFYQKPDANFLLRKASLDLAKATHYILNFQRVHNGQTLRVESFYKKYQHLITTNNNDPFDISNEGLGYAKGIELFWRDKTNIRNLDYWISYSFLDTRRKFLDYASLVQPSFAARHTVSVVAKRFVSAISTQFSATYSYASGRPYFNPNRPAKEFMLDRTIDYHSLGLQANYLRTFGKVNAVFIVNISNALGFKQVFGYRYASHINTSGEYASEAVTPMAKRFVFLGAYLSIGSDRRKNIID